MTYEEERDLALLKHRLEARMCALDNTSEMIGNDGTSRMYRRKDQGEFDAEVNRLYQWLIAPDFKDTILLGSEYGNSDRAELERQLSITQKKYCEVVRQLEDLKEKQAPIDNTINRIRILHEDRINKIMGRNLWQRILNKRP